MSVLQITSVLLVHSVRPPWHFTGVSMFPLPEFYSSMCLCRINAGNGCGTIIARGRDCGGKKKLNGRISPELPCKVVSQAAAGTTGKNTCADGPPEVRSFNSYGVLRVLAYASRSRRAEGNIHKLSTRTDRASGGSCKANHCSSPS